MRTITSNHYCPAAHVWFLLVRNPVFMFAECPATCGVCKTVGPTTTAAFNSRRN